MALYGYARVSTLDQNLGIQRAALKAAGCDVIRAEKASGTRRDGRTELQVLLDFLRPGDALVVTRIDRLARSLLDLQNIVHELNERRVTLRATEQPIDTGTAAGKEGQKLHRRRPGEGTLGRVHGDYGRRPPHPALNVFRDRLVAAGKPRIVALVATARKLLTIPNAIVRDGKAWQEVGHGAASN